MYACVRTSTPRDVHMIYCYFQHKLSQNCFLYRPLQRSWKGVYWFRVVRPSVRLSGRLWTKPCPLCIFRNTGRIHLIFAHLIKKLEKVCHEGGGGGGRCVCVGGDLSCSSLIYFIEENMTAGDFGVSDFQGLSHASNRGRQVASFRLQITSLCQSTIKLKQICTSHYQTQTNMYIARARGEPILAMKSSGLNAHSSYRRAVDLTFLVWSSIAQSVCEWVFSLLVILTSPGHQQPWFDYVEYVSAGLTWGRILRICVISMWSNDIKCKYMFYVLSEKFST